MTVRYSSTRISQCHSNQDFDNVVNLLQYQAIAQHGIVLTNYNSITHPSQPNYIAAVAATNFGITDDDYYDIPANETSIFDLLEQKGLSWKTYNEDIPAAGWTGYANANSTYFRKHNPAVQFDSIGLNQTRSANIVHCKTCFRLGRLVLILFYS